MTLYLTSNNKDKLNSSKILLDKFNITNIICVKSESGIEGGQPYGLNETEEGCINRTLQFYKNENFISIENGFVKENETMWYDIAYIYIMIDNKYYKGLSEKRWFPKELYNNTPKLIEYFEKNSISRFRQLSDCISELIKYKV